MLSPSDDISPCGHAQLLVDPPKAEKNLRKVRAPLKTSVPAQRTETHVSDKLGPSLQMPLEDTNATPGLNKT